jgi:hypothetical protein
MKINGQAFHYFLLNIVQTARRPSLRIWYKHSTTEELEELRKPIKVEEMEKKETSKPTYNHIRDLSLLVNTGGYYQPDSDSGF